MDLARSSMAMKKQKSDQATKVSGPIPMNLNRINGRGVTSACVLPKALRLLRRTI